MEEKQAGPSSSLAEESAPAPASPAADPLLLSGSQVDELAGEGGDTAMKSPPPPAVSDNEASDSEV